MKKKRRRYLPSDLVALADLVHAPRESAESSEEDGNGAGALVGDAPGEPDRSEPARRWTVLENRHVLHARHPGLLPYICLRHLSFFAAISSLLLRLQYNITTMECSRFVSSLYECVKALKGNTQLLIGEGAR